MSSPVKTEHHKDVDGIRSTLLQIRSSVRGAGSGIDAIQPMLSIHCAGKRDISFADRAEEISEDLRQIEREVYEWYRATYDSEAP